jgi:hypothetical protein
VCGWVIELAVVLSAAMMDSEKAGRFAAPLRPSPTRWEIDAAGGRNPGERTRLAMVASSVSPGRSRTMFSMPLAYPSTLDHRSPLAHDLRWSTSYVEGRWSPSLGAVSGKAQAKANAIASVHFRCTTPKVFLSQAGPRFDLELVQAEHHLCFRSLTDRLPKRKRRPMWVALVWPVMRLGI